LKFDLKEKIKRLFEKNKSKCNDEIVVSGDIKIVSIGEIESLVNNTTSSKPVLPVASDGKKENPGIYIPFEQPIIIKKPPPQKIRGMKSETHHSKKLWTNKEELIEPKED